MTRTQKRRDFSSPLLQEAGTGRPLAIAPHEGARWFKCQTHVVIGRRIVVGAGHRAAPSLFPRLLRQAPIAHHGRGRPRRADRSRELVLFVAWARDVAGCSQGDVAGLLFPIPDDLGTREAQRDTRRNLKRVRDAEKTGRALYLALGVLPWAAFDDAKPPVHWWQDPIFEKAVRRWQLEALTDPSDEPQPDPERARRELLARLQVNMSEIVATVVAQFAPTIAPMLAGMRDSIATVFPQLADDESLLRHSGVEPWTLDGGMADALSDPHNGPTLAPRPAVGAAKPSQ